MCFERFLLLMVIIFKNGVAAEFLNKLKEMKNKIPKIGSKTHKTWQFLGHDVQEYPGINHDNRLDWREKWVNYYTCLEKKLRLFGTHEAPPPRALMAFEGTSVTLECLLCISPADEDALDLVVWEYQRQPSAKVEELEAHEHYLISPEDRSLQMFNVQLGHAGRYQCKMKHAPTTPYFLSVVNETEPTVVVRPDIAMVAPLAQQPDVIEGPKSSNLTVYTTWGPWSPCSRCKSVGKKVRFGVCTLKYMGQKIPNNYTDSSLAVLKMFKKGIPCRSNILPDILKNLTSVKLRKSEIMTAYCKVTCPEAVIFEVRDKNGNVLETANNSAGIYSKLQGVPDIKPPVTRISIFDEVNRKIILKCPGNLNSDAPIKWQIGTKVINPHQIAEATNGRIFINVNGHLNIMGSKLTDSRLYSCWQDNSLAGTIRLTVEKKFKITFDHHVILLGITAILGTFLVVFYRAFIGRHRPADYYYYH